MTLNYNARHSSKADCTADNFPSSGKINCIAWLANSLAILHTPDGKLRDELLEREALDTPLEAKALIERWWQHYNTIRPHSACGTGPRSQMRGSPVRSLRLRLSKRTGLVC